MRRGFTLAELIVVTAVAGTAAAFMIGTLVRQQRFYTSAAAILDVRAQLRDAADVLVTDLRGAAVATLGLPMMTDSAVEMYATIASSVVCATLSAQSLALPPLTLASGHTLTSMLAQPDTGDLALLYGMPAGAPDSGRWETLRVTSFAPRSLATSCPESSGFTAANDASTGVSGFVATLATAPVTPIRKGAPIHFVRRARYSLYRSSDARWYLGYRRCNSLGPSVCATIQPLSGPYDPYVGSSPASGLSFRYYDAGGAQLTPGSASASIARIEIVVRGRAAGSSNLPGDMRTAYRDSEVVTVSPRNRWR